jgi:hypothetical protein
MEEKMDRWLKIVVGCICILLLSCAAERVAAAWTVYQRTNEVAQVNAALNQQNQQIIAQANAQIQALKAGK